nr:DUF3141 domain-containing protein [Sinorhizobium meliloti]
MLPDKLAQPLPQQKLCGRNPRLSQSAGSAPAPPGFDGDQCAEGGVGVCAIRDWDRPSFKPRSRPNASAIGNCQAGWAPMSLASLRPELFGPIVITPDE